MDLKRVITLDATYFLRQVDIADASKFNDKPITVIGACEIGATSAVALTKTGSGNVTVYDFDMVEEHDPSIQPDPWLAANPRH